jgi:hypothetical protein
MEVIFVLANMPWNFIPGERVRESIFVTTDLFETPWWRKIFPSMARFSMGYRCRSCKQITLDYGKKYTHQEAREILDEN